MLNIALPGDIPTQSTQSFNIPNRADAGRAALDLLRAKEKRGITSLSNMAEKNEELRKELEILQGRAGERFANNIDEATSFYKPEGTGMDALNQMLSDPANYEINRVGRLSPEELAQSPFGETEAKYVVPPIGDPITDAELSEARDIYGDFDPTLGAPYVAPSSDIELEMAQPTDGGITSVPEGGPNFTARRAGEILESLKTAPRTTAASEAARRSMSEAPLGGSEALINPFDFTRYGNSRNRGIDAEAKLIEQGILAGDNQLMVGTPTLSNAAKTAAFATQGMTPGTPEYLNTLIETADAASMAGDVPRQRVITDALQQPSGGMDDSGDITAPVVAPSVTLEGMGIDPANYPTEEGLRRDRERFNTPGVGDAATAGQVKILEGIAAGEDITSEGYGLGTPSVGSDLTREDVIRLKRGLPSGEPAVVSTDPAQPATTADTDGGGTDIFDSYAALTRSMKAPNKGETNLIRNAMVGARHTEDGPGYKKGDLVVEDRFADKVLSGFETALSFILPGAIDFKGMSQENRNKALQAYYDTGKIVYEEGKPVGFEDKEGGLVRLVPKGRDDTEGDDDCPPGFQRVDGVCVPTSRSRVAANPATSIEDAIASATLPSTLRPVVRDVVDDDDEEEETSDVGGLTIRRPNYFADGGAVSEGMGSAIDSFISAMGGSVKKKSNVEPVNMFFGGLVDRFTGRNDYTDPYEELGRDYGYDPTDPFGDGDTSYGDDGPSDTVTADTFIGPMQPNVTYQPPAAPVDTGGDDKPVKALGFQFDPRNANITGLPEIEDFMQRKSAEPYRSEQYIYNEMNPLNKGDITEGLEDNDFLMPEFMRGPLMISNQHKTSVPQAAIDMGAEFFNTVKEDPLGVLGDAAVGLGKGAFDFLYNPPQTVWNAAKGIYEAVTDLGTETNARDRLGNIIGAAGIVPGTRALQVAGRPVANAVDAAQTAQAANFQSAISGTPVPNTGGIMNPRIETNLDPNESMLAQRIIGNAEQDLRSGMSAPEVMAKHDVAVYPQKNAAGETTGHEVMYRFDADRFKYDEEKFAKLPVGEQITLGDVTIESPFKNMGSDIQKNVTLENQKETRIGNLIKSIKEGRGPAGFFDDIHGGIARKTGTGTQIINYNEPQPNLIPHEILHATEQRALNKNLRDAMTGGGSQSKGRRINERIDDLKAQMKAGFPEVGSLEMRMAKMQDAKQEIAALKNISPEAAYMNNALETYARSAEGGVDRLGVYDMTRLEALNPKINQANILKRMAQGLGGKDSRAKYVPMTYEMIQGLNPVTTRADALTRSRFNNP
jgi:hypothetical protein